MPLLGAAVDQDGAITGTAILGPGHDDQQPHQVAIQSADQVVAGLVGQRGSPPAF